MLTLFEQFLLLYFIGAVATCIFLEFMDKDREFSRDAIILCSFGWPFYWIAAIFVVFRQGKGSDEL